MSFSVACRPKVLDTLRGCSRAEFGGNLAAGVTVGIVALPLTMAVGVVSDRSCQAGFLAAATAGLRIAARRQYPNHD